MLSILVILYILLNGFIAFRSMRLVGTGADFMSGGRRIPFFLSSAALFALWFGSETVFGASSEFIKHGFLGVIEDPFGGALCLVLFAMIFVRPLYRRNILTLGDLFRQAFGKRIEVIGSAFMMLTFFTYVAAQLMALGILFNTVFGLDREIGILVSAAIAIVYTASGGMWAVSLTDFIQSVVIVFGLVSIVVYLSWDLDLSEVFAHQPTDFYRFIPLENTSHSWIEYMAAWLTLGLGSLASQDIFQRANAAKSEKTAVRSTYFGALLYLVFAMLPLFLGLLVHYLEPQLVSADTELALMEIVRLRAPLWIQVLFYGALISAIFSTCSGALLAPASLLSENILKGLFKVKNDDPKFLLISRVSVLIIGIISTVLAFGSGTIYDLVAQASVITAVCILVPMTCALFLPKTSSLGAGLSMAFGLGGYILSEYFLHTQFPPMFIGVGASVLGIVAGDVWHKGISVKS